MQWDDRLFTGQRERWDWFVTRDQIDDLLLVVTREHIGCRLWITTFDSGSITPSDEEIALGWRVVGDAMVSPPITVDLCIPRAPCEEWYIFTDATNRHQDFERFISYSGFHLADPRQMAESFNPTWERDGLDWLYPLQHRFWTQMDILSPLSYIGSGDNDIVVTDRRSFADAIRRALHFPSRMSACDRDG